MTTIWHHTDTTPTGGPSLHKNTGSRHRPKAERVFTQLDVISMKISASFSMGAGPKNTRRDDGQKGEENTRSAEQL